MDPLHSVVVQEQEDWRREQESRLRREGKLPAAGKAAGSPPPPRDEKKSAKSEPIPKLGRWYGETPVWRSTHA